MKKLLIVVFVLAVLGGVGYAVFTGHVPALKSDRHIVIGKTHRFFECVKFKEFGEAGNFHTAEDAKKADIPKMIEDLFKVPPEYLDVQDVNILFAEIDSSKVLAKVKTRCTVQLLNTKEIRHPECILYWKLENGEWYLKLRSTLERGKLR